MSIELRPERRPIRFSGPDAEKLLNDVLTGTITTQEGVAHWWALLAPQGKVQAEGLAGWHDGAFWLDVHESMAASFVKRMSLYRLRAKVDIDDLGEEYAIGWSADEPSEGFVDRDERAGGLGFRVITTTDAAANWSKGSEFQSARIARGVVEVGADYPADSLFPHDIAMDILGGIDFAKGCYVGQEVVSRMKHRGTARRRPVVVSGETMAVGDEIMAGDRSAGSIGTSVGGKAVAILRLDRIADGAETLINGSPVSLALPDWASYRFGESGAAD